MKDLTIYNVYVEMESQVQCDRMKQLCIDNNLPIWEDEIGFEYFETSKFNKFIFDEESYCFFACIEEIIVPYKTQVTEQEFINLLKQHKYENTNKSKT